MVIDIVRRFQNYEYKVLSKPYYTGMCSVSMIRRAGTPGAGKTDATEPDLT